jgi:ABC-2 type transport system ATP-binding protein
MTQLMLEMTWRQTMPAARFIGRVGGLAIAMGVGVTVFGGPGAAWADSAETDAVSSAGATREPASSARGRNAAASAAPRVRAEAKQRDSDPAPAPASAASVKRPSPAAATVRTRPAVAVPDIRQGPAVPAQPSEPYSPVAVAAPAPTAGSVSSAPPAAEALAPTVAPAPTVSGFLTAAGGGLTDSADSNAPIGPVLPLEWAAAAVARRQVAGAASTLAPDASDPVLMLGELDPRATPAFSEKGITADPTVFLDNRGNFIALMNAATERTDVALVLTGLSGSNGGKVTTSALPNLSGGGYNPQSVALLPYATWLDGAARGTETFQVGIREYTEFDQFFLGTPIISDLIFKPIIHALQDTPLISDLLAPLIGSAVVVPIEVDIAALGTTSGLPRTLAFTYDVTSFDGTKISTNFFPSKNLPFIASGTAPTVVIGSGFGFAGQTSPYALYALKDEVPGVGTLSSEGYNTITYDPRGRFASGGEVHMANPAYEGKDVSALLSWLSGNTPAALTAPGDPKVGLVGGSYGAALQFAAAGDKRIDAMVPVDGWDSLLDSFYPANTFRTAYGALTILSLLTTGSRVYPPLYWAFGTGMLANFVGPLSRNLLDQSNPPLDQLTAPTLMIRGTVDVLFPLQQGTASAEAIMANGNNVPLKMQWICTGHGVCNDPYGPAQTEAMALGTLSWLAQYVAGAGPFGDALAKFLWFDQKGNKFFATKLPFQEGFNDLPDVVAESEGGLLPLVPIIGGSGELSLTGIVNGTDAWNSIKIDVPTDKLAVGTQVVGTPTVSFTYRGLGLAGAVYAQIVNKTTGLVLGNVVMPVPVTLNGFKQTVSIDIGEIAYTVGEGDQLQVQLASSATAFFNMPLGLIDISDVTVTLPNRTVGYSGG